ncbi:MAG: hypothetical protein GXY08_09430 [Ruminococcus sp.]|nr:hypothetical protein [Ruminococcus sp.]
MKIRYYDIHDCEYEFLYGKPSVIAPDGADEMMLKRYSFIKLPTGRWCHYMTPYEISHMMSSSSDQLLVFANPPSLSPKTSASTKVLIILLVVAAFLIWMIFLLFLLIDSCPMLIFLFF